VPSTAKRPSLYCDRVWLQQNAAKHAVECGQIRQTGQNDSNRDRPVGCGFTMIIKDTGWGIQGDF